MYIKLINNSSTEMAKSRSLGRHKKKYEQLFDEAEKREEEMNKIKEDFYNKVCTFRPRISEAPPEIAQKINRVDYMDRAQQLLHKKEETKRENERIIRKDPEIGNKRSRRPPNVEVHEYLYGYMDKQKKDLEDLRQSQVKEVEAKRGSQRSKSTEKVIWENMDKKLEPLFYIFDVDRDG